MTCRCDELEKCEQDIQTLERDLLIELNAMQRNSGLEAVLPALNRDLAGAIFVENMARIETRLIVIKNQRENNSDNMLTRRSSELTRIQNKRSCRWPRWVAGDVHSRMAG